MVGFPRKERMRKGRVNMRAVAITLVLLVAQAAWGQGEATVAAQPTEVVFVSYAGNETQLERACNLAESIRTFAGRYKDAPIWVYASPELLEGESAALRQLEGLKVEIRRVVIPEETSWFFLSGMVFSAASAEAAADGAAVIVVFMGSDTIVLQEPHEFILADSVVLGYRPVMHKNISPLYSEPLDTYWKTAYDLMGIDEAAVFPMVTQADGDTIRPYVNAGCMAIRPERSIFRKWAEIYKRLCRDSVLKAESVQDGMKRVFTFQVALTGAVLNNLKRGEMVELSQRYNYPIFFREMFGAKRDFHDITDAATIRYEHFFDEPPPNWEEQLQGPPDRITWIKEHCEKD